LKIKGIAHNTYYPLPLHKQKAFEQSNGIHLPNSELLCQKAISLPIFPGLKTDEISYICQAIKEICE
jgi:UDP-2-acetamido-2-deoxy-ribo-hexuluronate aminotransferase